MTPELHQALGRTPERPAEPKPARPRPRHELEQFELDPELVKNPARMNYALLLALLQRNDGEVTLTKRDLEVDEEHLNVLFALSLDGTRLNVSVVSTDSGIIRSPEAKWAPSQSQTPPYLSPPLPDAADREALEALRQLNQPVRAGLAGSEALRVVEMPQPAPRGSTPPGPAAKPSETPGYVFPFETGSSPTTATTNLQSLQAELAKDQKVALEQQQAAARVEGG
jgi:hypothetical protein